MQNKCQPSVLDPNSVLLCTERGWVLPFQVSLPFLCFKEQLRDNKRDFWVTGKVNRVSLWGTEFP